MKYIRTKDGRIIKVREGFEGKEWETSDEYFYKHYHSRADTVEELCDSEVIVWNDSKPSIWNKFLTKQEFERLYSSFQRKKIIAVYGAIWTDEGLIYVAKMKGVLSNGEIDWELL